MLKEIRKAKYPIETRNNRLIVFLTTADSLISEIFVDLWLSLDTSIGTFSMVSGRWEGINDFKERKSENIENWPTKAK